MIADITSFPSWEEIEKQIKRARVELCVLQEMFYLLNPEYKEVMDLIKKFEEMLGVTS